MKLIPYLTFDGDCEEAIHYYQSVFDGNVVHKDYYASAPIDVPESHKNKILHCQLDFGGNSIMACDGFPGDKTDNGNGIVLSVEFDQETKASEIFSKLSAEGNVTMPFEKQFLGAWLGQLVDKFGKNWMISANIYG
jgi:PhnB protein